jgi:histidinol-phosphate/aromatic aminotransferase/cobyric acid decarboxylase-like protein
MRRLFGYYRQFDELSPDEVSRELLAARDEERRRHPATLPPLDLSGAAWPGPPHPEAINAATFALRRAVNAYPDGEPLRAAIAALHDVDPARVMLGHGAGELIRAALRAVASPETEILWPGWGLLPGLVSEVGATPVPVAADELVARRAGATGDSGDSAARTLVAARPNDPTGDPRRGARGLHGSGGRAGRRPSAGDPGPLVLEGARAGRPAGRLRDRARRRA